MLHIAQSDSGFFSAFYSYQAYSVTVLSNGKAILQLKNDATKPPLELYLIGATIEVPNAAVPVRIIFMNTLSIFNTLTATLSY